MVLLLDGEKSSEALARTFSMHVRPFCARHGLPVDAALLAYVSDMCEGLGSGDGDDLEQLQIRCIAVLRCISGAPERANAAIAVMGASHSPDTHSTASLRSLAADALTWRGCGAAVSDKLAEQLRLIQLQDIVYEYGAKDFSVGDPAHASLLVSHICAQTHRPRALADALTVSGAYAHLSPRDAAIAYFQSLCMAPPTVAEVRAAAAVPVAGGAGSREQSLVHRVVTSRCTAVLALLDTCTPTVAPPAPAAICDEVCEFIGITLDDMEGDLGIFDENGADVWAALDAALTAACGDDMGGDPSAAPVQFPQGDHHLDERWISIVSASCSEALGAAAAACITSYGGSAASRGTDGATGTLPPSGIPVCPCALADFTERIRIIRALHSLGFFVGPASLRGGSSGRTKVFLSALSAPLPDSASPHGAPPLRISQGSAGDVGDDGEPDARTALAYRLAEVLSIPRDRVRGMLAVAAAR